MSFIRSRSRSGSRFLGPESESESIFLRPELKSESESLRIWRLHSPDPGCSLGQGTRWNYFRAMKSRFLALMDIQPNFSLILVFKSGFQVSRSSVLVTHYYITCFWTCSIIGVIDCDWWVIHKLSACLNINYWLYVTIMTVKRNTFCQVNRSGMRKLAIAIYCTYMYAVRYIHHRSYRAKRQQLQRRNGIFSQQHSQECLAQWQILSIY